MLEKIREVVRRLLAIEPAVIISTASGLVLIAANLGLPVAGIDVPAIVAYALNLLALVATVLGVRQSVYSPATHDAEVQQAYEAGIQAATWSDAEI